MSTGPGGTPGFSMLCFEKNGVHWDCVDIPLEPALLVRREQDGDLIALSEAGAHALADPLVDTAFKRLLALGHDVRIFPNADGESLRFAFNQLAEGAPAQLAAAGRRAHDDYVLGWAARLRNKIFRHGR